MQGWVFAHFRQLVMRRRYEDYDRKDPYVCRWKPARGFSDVGYFKLGIDSMDHSHVTWRSYEHQQDVTPFQDVCWYSGWIMADKDRMVRHLSERVLRQYDHVQTVPRHPTTIEPLEPTQVVTTFLEFPLHVLTQQQRGEPISEGDEWMHENGYIKWFYKVSNPLMIVPAPVPEYNVTRLVYEEILVEQQWARHPPDLFQIIGNIRARMENAMGIHDVTSNPLFSGILEGIRSDYTMFNEVPPPWRRSRSSREQQ